MNRITIQQLRQMHESEDRFEFKAGKGGGRLVISMQDNYPHDLLSLFRASQGESQRHTDEVILHKLTNGGLLVFVQDGYKLSERYHEIARNVGTVENGRIDDMINVPHLAVFLAFQKRPLDVIYMFFAI